MILIFLTTLGISDSIVAEPGSKKQISLHTDSLVIALDSQTAWTIRAVDFEGDRMIIPAGGQGAVIFPTGGKWIGSAMGPDEAASVSKFEIFVDDKPTPMNDSIKGKHIRLLKESMLGDLKHRAETNVEGERIHQKHSFVAEASMTLKSFYAFIYSFSPKAQRWLAQGLAGEVMRGEFSGEGNKPAGPVQWLAQYDSTMKKGAVVYFQTPFIGRGSYSHFWDKKHYHKLLCQPTSGEIKTGTKMEFQIAMQFFSAEPNDWEKRAAELAENLKTRFPKKEIAMPEKNAAEDGIPETGFLTLKTDAYSLLFEAASAWTIDKMFYRGKQFGLNNGHYGTVLTPKGGKWWGTGHSEGGREVVHSLKLTVDDEERAIRAGETLTGKQIRLVKESTIWKFKAAVEIILTNDHVFERTQLEALEDCETSVLYYFMHCIPPTTTKWLGQMEDGSLAQGELKAIGKMAVNKNTRWLSQFDPTTGLGILCYTPKIITGSKSASLIWDLDRYHKYYLRQNHGQKFRKGEKLDFTVIVKAVPDESGNWVATKRAATELAESFPAEKK
ncbi:MAG: hypothetical protein QF437_11320 [Planctomycetota bacterium]|nr:hypothetical protein [Planctomycetota bacterium]